LKPPANQLFTKTCPFYPFSSHSFFFFPPFPATFFPFVSLSFSLPLLCHSSLSLATVLFGTPPPALSRFELFPSVCCGVLLFFPPVVSPVQSIPPSPRALTGLSPSFMPAFSVYPFLPFLGCSDPLLFLPSKPFDAPLFQQSLIMSLRPKHGVQRVEKCRCPSSPPPPSFSHFFPFPGSPFFGSFYRSIPARAVPKKS